MKSICRWIEPAYLSLKLKKWDESRDDWRKLFNVYNARFRFDYLKQIFFRNDVVESWIYQFNLDSLFHYAFHCSRWLMIVWTYFITEFDRFLDSVFSFQFKNTKWFDFLVSFNSKPRRNFNFFWLSFLAIMTHYYRIVQLTLDFLE